MKKYFVIGNPIEHSLSPKLHNYWFKKNNIIGSYDKKKIDEDEIETVIKNMKKKLISGANVTVPFKKKVIPFLDKLSPSAEQTQSVNTIVIDNNKLIGHNTDIFGFKKAISKTKYNLKSKKIFILGAGGVVPSIIYALKKMEVSEIIISNRTREKAENLNIIFDKLKIEDWGKIPNFDVIINATSLGLNKEIINIDLSKVGKNKLFYDVIYNPKQTHFLKTGKKLGNQTQNGELMFVYQAFKAFKLWHNIEPQIDSEVLKFLSND
tara:strand:+ start:1072 stop:1866 length:795 start_codon:yes stop_codon:yes gene_type:complete